MKRVHITFPAGGITLEGVWHFPESSGPFPAVIVCHPHPLYGGNMSNNVVFAICQALAQKDIAALRFNFRGVGKSEGEYGEGAAEQEDARAALALALATPDIDPKKIGLAGYSFGGGVALPVAAQDKHVKMLALVSPALMDYGREQLKGYTGPKFIIIGEDDDMIAPEGLRELAQEIPGPKRFETIAKADHFWVGFEEEVAQKLSRFFAEGFALTKAP